MRLVQDPSPKNLIYQAGLDKIQEAVISSHFMHELVKKTELELYDEQQFATKSLEIDSELVYGRLIPDMLSACNAFCSDRAAAAKPRARENYRKYGLEDPCKVGIAECITEVMFDRQYVRGRESCSRELLCRKVKERIESDSPIEMVIPALPFKFSSPLKTRGRLPDLAEVNFILGLYEIAATIESIYREGRPDLQGRLAGFTVVSDGSRFNKLVDEPDSIVTEYRNRLSLWIKRLGLEGYITIIDYQNLLGHKLPAHTLERKTEIAKAARSEYADILWSIFDACDMAATMKAAAIVEPDPEYSNAEGRFVPLLKSLIFTINYKTLKKLERISARNYRALYRELTGHIFEPYTILSPSELESIHQEADANDELAITGKVKEYMRQMMLREAWSAAIDYIAEIKSDRELDEDPILTCLPDRFRWTIHAKRGQLAILTPTALGTRIQAWAGAAVFKLTKKNRIKLCTLPILALEGAGAIPVMASEDDQVLTHRGQPLFYIYPDIGCADLAGFLLRVKTSLVRKRTS